MNTLIKSVILSILDKYNQLIRWKLQNFNFFAIYQKSPSWIFGEIDVKMKFWLRESIWDHQNLPERYQVHKFSVW